ncbi:transglutaminase-like domain-containing protein [Thermococcus pacificus]|uniref:Transglutaminase-like domain-containing protein n=1 Tax=Thermococcus pacificus TaxID=71998 RepID=A0A218P9W0_9EURY|nr:transglutaminase-like domain-containing protein [Thermococcus pacificus]ASJ07530.1 hypothetical protein A3L08_09470 [Thermococcus pacificus]
MGVLLKGIIKLIIVVLIISAIIYDHQTGVITVKTSDLLQKAGINTIDRDAYLKKYSEAFDCSKPYWRNWGPGIIKCDINESEINAIMPVAEKVKGRDILETAWNLHKWEVENTDYDYEKFMALEGGTLLPHEFLQKKKGVCRDYAVFNYAVMKALGYRDIYLAYISMSSSIWGHAVLVFKYNGTYYALDWWGPQKIDAHYAERWEGSLSIVILNDKGEVVSYVGVTPWEVINRLPQLTVMVIGILLIVLVLKY